ncbi:hypothetical protein HDZ31DRAFT_78188, partial [Schizophyllum fasciatum]
MAATTKLTPTLARPRPPNNPPCVHSSRPQGCKLDEASPDSGPVVPSKFLREEQVFITSSPNQEVNAVKYLGHRRRSKKSNGVGGADEGQEFDVVETIGMDVTNLSTAHASYSLFKSLGVFEGPISCMVFSPHGKFLAFSTWVYFNQTARYSLVTASLHGQVCLWHLEGDHKVLRPANSNVSLPGQVVALAVDSDVVLIRGYCARVAISTIDGTVVVMSLTSVTFKPNPVYQSKIEALIPKNLAFVPPLDSDSRQESSGQPGVNEGLSDLLVFSHLSRRSYRLDLEGRCIYHMTDGPEKMASVCMMQNGQKFLSWTGNQFELVDLAEGRKSIKSFPVGQLSRLLPKHGVFTRKDTVVVCGTDEAHASVFDPSPYRTTRGLQAYASPSDNTDDIVAIASSNLTDESQVVLFRECQDRPEESVSTARVNPAVYRVLKWLDNIYAIPLFGFVLAYCGRLFT